ncbi:hypothetical protein [Pseudoxanthomonas mexicana]
MISNFSHTRDSLLRINGNSSRDAQKAQVAVDELKDFVLAQHKKIIKYVELGSIVTTSSSIEIKDALTAMRHVTSVLDELATFHASGLLATTFEVAFHYANEALKKAEKQAEKLLSYVVK